MNLPDLLVDLRNSEFIINKMLSSEKYCQNLYAALCQNEFVKYDDTWNILKENAWGCSWRAAGGIVAELLDRGDYMDWYCSGILHLTYDSDEDKNRQAEIGYVPEGEITDEIAEDLRSIGWVAFNGK